MTKFLSSIWARAIIVGLVLTAALGWIVAGRVAILKNGREIVLKTRPVDPRDLFRGHYVRLNYDISRIRLNEGRKERFGDLRRNQTIYVTLKPGADGYWVFDSASRTMPAPRGDRVTLKGWLRYAYPSYLEKAYIAYGLERYYAPKKRALELEKMTRRRNRAGGREERPLGVIVRVGSNGKAAIAGLMIDGEKVYEEPMF